MRNQRPVSSGCGGMQSLVSRATWGLILHDVAFRRPVTHDNSSDVGENVMSSSYRKRMPYGKNMLGYRRGTVFDTVQPVPSPILILFIMMKRIARCERFAKPDEVVIVGLSAWIRRFRNTQSYFPASSLETVPALASRLRNLGCDTVETSVKVQKPWLFRPPIDRLTLRRCCVTEDAPLHYQILLSHLYWRSPELGT